MSDPRLLQLSEHWFRLLQRFYPPDFRDELGGALVEAYLDRGRDALKRSGTIGLIAVCLRALADSLRSGAGERLSPAAAWRRGGNWGRDVELVRRRLFRSPMFAVTTIGTLTIGLGLFAVVYTAVQKILLDPMPYRNPGDLYFVWRDYGPTAEIQRGSLAGTDIVELQKPNSVIEGAAGLAPFLGGIFAPKEGAEPMEIAVTWASPNLFDLLGVSPALGRGFLPDEIGPGRGEVIILSHHLWKRLGGDAEIVGKSVRLQGRPRTVVGVLAANFTFVRNDAAAPPQRVDAYVPFESDPVRTRNNGYAALVRARHGSSAAAVGSAVDAIGRVIDARDFGQRGLRLYPVGLKADVLSRIRPALIVLAAAGGVLLLMLMVNLASVLLARAALREHEVAVSRALGANTAAIVRSTLLEGGLLGFLGGALGTAAAIWGARALVALAPPDLPRRDAIAIDWRIGATVIAAGAMLGLLAAAAPALWAARAPLASLIAGSAVRGGGGQGRWRRGMVTAQVALSLVLLSTGALVVRSFDRLLRTDPGFRSEGVLTFRVRTPPEFFPKLSDAFGFQDRILQALTAIPGVARASATGALPLTGTPFQVWLEIPGAQADTGDAEKDHLAVDMVPVKTNYLEVMDIRLLDGRSFREARPNGALEVVIDSAIARRFFAGRSAVGAQVRLQNRPFTVIGVVRPARLYDIYADGRPQVLVRAEDFGMRPLSYVARTTREPRSLLPEIRAAIHRLDPRVPAGEEKTMDEIVRATRSPQSIGAALTGVFAAGALLLAAMGLFGVVSGSVTRRRHELAVRLACGADPGSLLGLVLKEGALLVVIGLLIGAPGIYFANGLIRGLLVGVSSSDPLTLFAAAAGLLLVTLVTCYVPARRALRIDPAELLRHD